jgi:hypothetical protein
VECINKNKEIMEKIERAITVDDTDEGELFCDECNKEIKSFALEVSFGRGTVRVVDREIKKG